MFTKLSLPWLPVLLSIYCFSILLSYYAYFLIIKISKILPSGFSGHGFFYYLVHSAHTLSLNLDPSYPLFHSFRQPKPKTAVYVCLEKKLISFIYLPQMITNILDIFSQFQTKCLSSKQHMKFLISIYLLY